MLSHLQTQKKKKSLGSFLPITQNEIILNHYEMNYYLEGDWMAFHTARHSQWGKSHLHGFSDERALEAQPWRTEGLCPWRALITLAWRPTNDQIKMLQAHHEQGNLCSGAEAALLLSALLSSFCYLPHDFSSPGTVPAHQTAPHFQGVSRITAETWIAWITPMCYFHFPSSPFQPQSYSIF